MNETFAPIPGFPGYAVSSRGAVRGPRGMLATPRTNGGYATCTLRSRGRKITTTVQRLVLLAFIGPAPSGQHEANHKNGDKLDNSAENLEWVTPQENKAHAVNVLGKQFGRTPKPRTADGRRIIPFDLRPAGGGNYEVVPIAGLTKWTLRDAETHEEKTRGTMKQILRWLSRDTVHMLPFDAFH